jgi:DNA gyrase/topoisomerase IV subunit A
VQNNCFNVYGEFEHEPDNEGNCRTILFFLKHIYGKQYRLGVDYIQLLYQKPTQILPIKCLVSRENNTGKTTYIKFLKAMFTSNCTVIGNEELNSAFNASYSNKLIIACEESFIEKKGSIEKIKNLSTADKIMMNAKGKDQVEIDFFGKFILASNNDDDFIYASNYDIRYWVINVPKPKENNVNLLNQMIEEIPAFLAYLNRRKLSTTCQSRMWFTR